MDITKAHDKKEPFHKIFLVYEYEQPLYKQYKEWFSDRIVITNQLSDIDLEDASAEANGRPNLLILDDCLLKLSSNNRDANQFLSLMTGSSHHLRFSHFSNCRAREPQIMKHFRTSVLFTTQSFFLRKPVCYVAAVRSLT